VTIGVYAIDGPAARTSTSTFVYFHPAAGRAARALPDGVEGWRWVSEDALRKEQSLDRPGRRARPDRRDVRRLGLDAIAAVHAHRSRACVAVLSLQTIREETSVRQACADAR